MRFLKRLQLQGYKTFAARTEFIFDAGITAIVGPNGSGKSNIADGLRWVLGEQSYSALRGKRTEDMIFSGSEQRARLGMAHVSLTFDNSTGWLPIDFAEVEIARRAYRSGENEYYLNGNRVRLRDIGELFGSSGLSERTYTAIGQGLIDQALSQRPEERRKLFEEAAGITVHQNRREQAVQKLEEAGANLTRARDIISELAPRLRYLKGQARRAQEYRQLKTDLDAQLQIWYGFKWRQGLLTQAGARERATECVRSATERAESLSALSEQLAAQQAERSTLRDRLSEWHSISSQLHRRAETIQRELAVRSEQHRLWGEQCEDLERELIHVRAASEDGAARLKAAEAELAEVKAVHEAHASRLAGLRADLTRRELERQAQAQRLTQAEEELLASKTQLADRRSRLAQIDERRLELAHAQADEAHAIEASAAQLAELEKQVVALDEKTAAFESELKELEQARQAQSQALSMAQEEERKVTQRLSSAQRNLARLQDQRDLLARLRDEGAGMNAGARTVLAAASQLSGIIGALGDLIEVPSDLERAIETALGSRLQDIVVKRWADAEAAVALLKQRQAGRATFLPLDTLRPGRPVEVPAMDGVLGLAADLVRFDPAIRPAVELALNHIIIVRDLPTARRLLAREGRATLVTVEGEITRPGGSITGGSEGRGRDSGMLARSRSLRELPAQIRAAATEVAAIETQIAEGRKAQDASRSATAVLRSRYDESQAGHSRTVAETHRAQLAAERARQTCAWHEAQRARLAQEGIELDGREADLKTAVASLTDQLSQRESAVVIARRELAELATDDLLAEQAQLRGQAAVSAGQLRGFQARVDELAELQRRRSEEIAIKELRVSTLAGQRAEATRAIGEQALLAQELAVEISRYGALIEPGEARLAQLEQERREAESQERVRQEQLRHAQMRQSQAELAVQRAQDELAHLRSEIEKELGLVSLETDELSNGEVPPFGDFAEGGSQLVDDQPPLPLNGVVTPLPVVHELPYGLDRDVHDLRAQMARLGPVNVDALTEYNEVEARHNFLTSQATDLEQAVHSLQEVIAELDRVMEREFLSTFKAVAAQFRQEFTDLFGGGSAKLVLIDPDSPSTTGVEIIARPPGKREQGLALLSGGERALTAAALIFSILKMRPTPFCILDEVDAALDEANIGRFRDALKALGEKTQFIVITHNRGTIEVADTIYGVSMGADNTSRVLSLKLEGKEVVPVKPVLSATARMLSTVEGTDGLG